MRKFTSMSGLEILQLAGEWEEEAAAAAREALLERGLLLFKLIGNLHARSDLLPPVSPTAIGAEPCDAHKATGTVP